MKCSISPRRPDALDSPALDRFFTGQQTVVANAIIDFPHEPVSGRRFAPDPAGLAAVAPDNPQSWNRYAYVNGTPLTSTDPKGLHVTDCMWEGCVNPCPDCPGVALTGGGGGGGASGPTGYGADIGPPGFIDSGWLFQVSDEMEGRYVSLITTGWDPELGRQDVETTNHDPSACEDRVISAVNQQFGTSFSDADVVRAQVADGGEYNVTISASNLPAGQFNAIQTGRYASLFTMFTGIGPSLHVTGPTSLDPSATFVKENNGAAGGTSIILTAHIDSAYAYNPLGLIGHLISDVLNPSSRSPCP